MDQTRTNGLDMRSVKIIEVNLIRERSKQKGNFEPGPAKKDVTQTPLPTPTSNPKKILATGLALLWEGKLHLV